MALPRRIPISHDDAFPHGAYVVGQVEPVLDFDKSTRETRVQQLDQDTHLPIWQVPVMDADPECPKAAKQVSVKIISQYQPVPPPALEGLPFSPVRLEGLTVSAWIEQKGGNSRPRVQWSFRATEMVAPSAGGRRPRPAPDQAA